MDRSFAYVIEIYAASLAAEVHFNGWLVHQVTDPQPRSTGQKLNSYLIEGDNTLEVQLGPWQPTTAEQADFWFKLYKIEHGQEGSDDDVLAFFRWTPFEYPLNDEGLTRVFSHRLNVRQAFGRWGWQDAKPYMPPDRPDIERLVTSFHSALKAKDTARLVDMLEMRIEELARSVDLPVDESRAQQGRYFQRLFFDEPDWQIDPLDPATLKLASSAQGKLVSVTGADGGSPLVGSAGPTPFEFDLWVSNIGGRWQIAR